MASAIDELIDDLKRNNYLSQTPNEDGRSTFIFDSASQINEYENTNATFELDPAKTALDETKSTSAYSFLNTEPALLTTDLNRITHDHKLYDRFKNLNIDPNPIIVHKKQDEKVEYVQNINLKYLAPPEPEKPGDLVISQEVDVQIPPAPPLLVVKEAEKPIKPPAIIIREKPPKKLAHIPPQEIVIPGKILPPPPRKVIIEKLAQLPPKPADIVIERWLGYEKRTRNVIFNPAKPITPLPVPKNVIIQWDTPDVEIKKQYNYLGVETVDPDQYLAMYGGDLVESSFLPEDAGLFEVPSGYVLGCNQNPNELPMLVGDVGALRFIDLNKHNLAEYKYKIDSLL